jgi:hypothetical protein
VHIRWENGWEPGSRYQRWNGLGDDGDEEAEDGEEQEEPEEGGIEWEDDGVDRDGEWDEVDSAAEAAMRRLSFG